MMVQSVRIRLMKRLLLALGILVVALIVVLILMLAMADGGNIEEKKLALKENGRYLEGIRIGTVDVSGMTYAEAAANEQIKAEAQAVVDAFTYTVTVNGEPYEFTAPELGLTSNREKVLEEALYYGQVGDGATRREQRRQAEETGVVFELAVWAEEEAVLEKIKELKPRMDRLPQDAKLEFSDDGNERFTYVPEVTGVDVDAVLLARLITSRINGGDYSVVEAPAIITNPRIDAATLKANTQLIGTFTSSFGGSKSLYAPDRVTNIRIMADIVNGTVIEPGEIWSINEAAGPRNEETAKTVGWAYAPGISDGKYAMEIGGGVCQVSSTVYNAAVRAELEIVERRQHSWPSHYIMEGMDATISTGGPDLKISNPLPYPVYIAVHVDEEEKTVRVDIYGPETRDYTVEFTHEKVASEKAPPPVYHYNAKTPPDGNPIPEGQTVVWRAPHDGQTWKVYKQYIRNGNVFKTEFFHQDVYRPIQGIYYVNGPDPESVLPTISPEEDS
ncbi:MAG: VanW family protein [Christensenellales bacterium]|jgi:vancomycin resistance protein YoaR